jgi:hypothetical protein
MQTLSLSKQPDFKDFSKQPTKSAEVMGVCRLLGFEIDLKYVPGRAGTTKRVVLCGWEGGWGIAYTVSSNYSTYGDTTTRYWCTLARRSTGQNFFPAYRYFRVIRPLLTMEPISILIVYRYTIRIGIGIFRVLTV